MTDTIPATVKTHTALPWVVEDDERTHICRISGDETIEVVGYNVSGEREVIGCEGILGGPEGEANAAFIVRACNSHYQLVSALREAIEELWDRDHSSMDRIQFERANASLFAALSHAGGE